jgi:hypothetical protein
MGSVKPSSNQGLKDGDKVRLKIATPRVPQPHQHTMGDVWLHDVGDGSNLEVAMNWISEIPQE